jgi:hypothetical protein
MLKRTTLADFPAAGASVEKRHIQHNHAPSNKTLHRSTVVKDLPWQGGPLLSEASLVNKHASSDIGTYKK